MAGKGVEQLYKNYGILADAGESISDVSESINMDMFVQFTTSVFMYFYLMPLTMWPPIFCASCFHAAQRSV